MKQKANAEAKSAEIDNEEKAAKVLQEYIVSPLQGELKTLRKEIKKLYGAIGKITDCTYSEKCPVKEELAKREEDEQ